MVLQTAPLIVPQIEPKIIHPQTAPRPTHQRIPIPHPIAPKTQLLQIPQLLVQPCLMDHASVVFITTTNSVPQTTLADMPTTLIVRDRCIQLIQVALLGNNAILLAMMASSNSSILLPSLYQSPTIELTPHRTLPKWES